MNPVTSQTSAEELLKLAATELPIVIWQTDSQLRFTASFGAGLAGLALENGAVIGVSLFDFFQTTDPDFPPIRIHREALAGKVGSYEIDWAGRFYHYRVAPLRSDEGEIVGCVGVAHDITESRQSQLALRESEARFRAFTENTSEVTLIVAPAGTASYASPSLSRVVGYEPPDVLGKPASDFVHPDDVAHVIQLLARAAASPSETIFVSNVRIRHRNGHYRHFEGSFTGMLGVPGIDGILVHCRDATDRVEAEQRFLQSQASWQSLVESAPDIVMNLDLDGNITFINRTIPPFTADFIIGTNCFDYAPAEDRDRARACFRQAIETGEAQTYEGKGPDDMPPAWYIARLAPIVRDNQVVAVTVWLTDVTELKTTERALRESEEKYRLLVDNQTDMIVTFESEGHLLYVSPSYCRVFGKAEEEILGTAFIPFIHEDDRDRVREALQRVMAPPHTAYVEERAWTSNGWRWQGWQNTAVLNAAGEVEFVVAVGRDITQQKDAEEALRRSEARFRAVFDHAGMGIALSSLRGDLLQWNAAFREMLGYSEEELARTTFRDFTFPEDVGPEIRGIREVVAGQRDVYRAEKRYRRKDGSAVWGNFTCTVVRDLRGEPSFAIGMVEDITQRKRVEEDLIRARDALKARVQEQTADLGEANVRLREEIEERQQAEIALKESEERFRLAFEESPWGMTIIALDGTWLQVNRAFCDMLGYQRAELLRMSVAQVTHPKDLERNSELTRQLAEGTIPSFRFEKRYVHKNGELVWAAVNATLVRDDAGRVLYGLTMVENITQRKQAEQTLRRAERLASIGTLAAGIAHEVNNPLGAIQLDAETAIYCSEQQHRQETVVACLQNIAASAKRGGQIVRDVLRFARSESTPKRVGDLRDAVVGACRLTRRLAEKGGVKIEHTPPSDVCSALFNSTEIEQVLVNLITNAIHASHADDRVEILLQREPETVCAVVRDFGVGMTSDQMDRIFDPFYTTRGTLGGTGLGLSISYGIVREHGGTIDVHSQPGAGTTMIVRLPNHTLD
jgi:PAS domain S-box-containing protein